MKHRRSAARFILDNSLLLLAGTVAAVAWANVDHATYDHIAHPLHFWVNDVGMVFFFALAAKEVFEATLPGGPLASPRRALSPLAAAVGGMVAPALIYVTLATTQGPPELARGWAIPCATDIAFSAMIARIVFPIGHPAVPFLLLLAIADDALGLIILALFYPAGALSLTSLGAFMTAAVLSALWLKRRQTRSFWPYVLGPGALSWAALYLGGFHPALAPRSCPSCLTAHKTRDSSPPGSIVSPILSTVSSTGGRRRCSSSCCSSALQTPGFRSPRLARERITWSPRSCSASRSEFCFFPRARASLGLICRQDSALPIFW